MCGILGRFAFNEVNVSRNRFESELEILSHRGPDSTGIWESENKKVIFGHKRLSIIDLSTSGFQPMFNEDKTLCITYNGEFYNYKEIRNDLIKKGHKFISDTDTEVIIHGFEEYGEEIIHKIRGMFSFVIYDLKTDSIFFARDRIGIKPFYYVYNENGFSFSSEIKPLLGISEIKKELKRKSELEFFAFGNVYQPNTMFENVFKLPAAHCGRVSGKGELSLRKYWTPYESKFDFSDFKSEKDYSDKLFELLVESVNYRLISDVPVGVFLSGGVDSTGILGLMKYLGKSDQVYTYNTGFENYKKYDESKIASSASKYYNTVHYQSILKQEELVSEIPKIIQFLDEPTSDPTVIPIYFLSKLARENGSIVLLNGDGADELFAGYEKWIKFLRYRKYWNILGITPKPIKQIIKRYFSNRNQFVISDLLNRSLMGSEFFIGDTGAFKGNKLYDELITKEFFEIFNKSKDEFDDMKSGNDYVEWISYWGIKSLVENVFMHRSDRLGMANSIEIRVPYLDKKVVEFGMQMPQNLKYKNNVPKYILKKALEKVVPNEFLYRNKMGFCVPVNEWIDERMFTDMMSNFGLLNDYVFQFGKEKLEGIKEQLSRERNGAKTDLIYDFYFMTQWLKHWMD